MERKSDVVDRQGICLPSKVNGLLEFSGRKRISGLFDLYYFHCVNHLKFFSINNSEISVKGYLATIIRGADSIRKNLNRASLKTQR